ncbi:MAG: cytochrome c family protein [Candidatus Marinimicrobia bacterium]|nr:cytochrome c family protein [Candidatus Neomarinimicrobiota bacterium]
MKKIVIIIAGIFVLGLVANEAAKSFDYIGSHKCKTCHKSEKKGAQYKKWEAGPHASAFETLKSEKSAKIATDKGLKVPAYEAPECLVCHVTGYGNGGYETQTADFWAEVTDKGKPTKDVKRMTALQSVGCEACHGAASGYKKSHKKDKALALTQGLIEPTEAVCVTCHNEKSPTYDKEKGFNFEERWKAIDHSTPKAE